MRYRTLSSRIARLAAAISLALVAVPAGAQAHSPTCPGTGTDSAVSSPVVIDASIACPDGAPALSVVYAPSVDGIVSLDDKAPTGGAPSDHDDLRFTPITPTGSTPSHVVFGNQTYTLKNVHYHGLAEHKFASQPGFSPLEAHLVHELDGPALGYVVLSVLLNTGDNGWSEHDHLLHEPPSTVGATKNVFAVNLQALLPPPGSRSYYRYTGSLTTPDANHVYYKPVNWIIFSQYGTATQSHISGVHDLWGPNGNKRGLQSNPQPPNIYLK